MHETVVLQVSNDDRSKLIVRECTELLGSLFEVGSGRFISMCTVAFVGR